MNFLSADLFSVEGRTVVLTGASGFLGRTFARALLENGARVIALGRSERVTRLSQSWIQEFGQEHVRAEQIDLYDLGAFSELLDRLSREEQIDALVNNAFDLSATTGFNIPNGGLDSSTFDHWSKSFTGLYWAVMATQRIGLTMKARRQGSIINIATMYAAVAPSPDLYQGTPFMNPPGYSAMKSGLLAFTRYTASFWGPDGIRCNAILPGPFSNTDDVGPNSVSAADPFLDRLKSRTALRRTGAAGELVGALIFLASDASSYVTGQGLVIDGGWTIT